MILDQDKARTTNRYANLKRRAESHDKTMKHLGRRFSEGENTNQYFDNIELEYSTWKVVFYNIFTMLFDVFLYLALITYFWTAKATLWVVILAVSGASGVLLFLSINKIINTIYLTKMLIQRKKENKAKSL